MSVFLRPALKNASRRHYERDIHRKTGLTVSGSIAIFLKRALERRIHGAAVVDPKPQHSVDEFGNA
jgi:hypothetical protein